MPPKKTRATALPTVQPTDDRTTFSAVQAAHKGRRVTQEDREMHKVEHLGRVRFRCIDQHGGFDGMRKINYDEVFDFPIALLERREQYEAKVDKLSALPDYLPETREFIEIDAVEYAVPKWCEPAPEEVGEALHGHAGVHGNAGTVRA
jgi:hypothetical protein